MNEKIKDSLSALFLGLLAVLVASIIIKFINNPNFDFFKGGADKITIEEINEKVEDIQRTLSPYEQKENFLKEVIVENFKNSSENNLPTNSFEKQIVVSGDFKDGYLYVRSSVNNKALTKNSGVYVKISEISNDGYREYGGHLIKDRSLETPESKDLTELLYKLSDIKYKERYFHKDIEVLSADWLKLFNNSNDYTVLGFTSTTQTGNIIELSIYYQCEESKECSVSVKK